MDNPNVELSQKVRIDVDDEKVIEQSVTYDSADQWLCLGHDGNEISLSLENYYKLRDLADKAINDPLKKELNYLKECISDIGFLSAKINEVIKKQYPEPEKHLVIISHEKTKILKTEMTYL